MVSAPPSEAAPPAAALPATAPLAALALAVVPTWASRAFLRNSSGATGSSTASWRLVLRSCLRKLSQRSHWRTWRRPGALERRRPSATSPSSSRTVSHVIWRASAASASETRARTSSDLMEGTVASIASAICS